MKLIGFNASRRRLEEGEAVFVDGLFVYVADAETGRMTGILTRAIEPNHVIGADDMVIQGDFPAGQPPDSTIYL